MGQVVVVYSVMPESPSVDLAALKDSIGKAIPSYATVRGMADKPVAFGLTAVHVMVVMDDKSGGAEDVEKALNGLKNIQSVDTVEVTLM